MDTASAPRAATPAYLTLNSAGTGCLGQNEKVTIFEPEFMCRATIDCRQALANLQSVVLALRQGTKISATKRYQHT